MKWTQTPSLLPNPMSQVLKPSAHVDSSPKVGSLFQVPKIVRHSYEQDPKRDPNLENYPMSHTPASARAHWAAMPRQAFTWDLPEALAQKLLGFRLNVLGGLGSGLMALGFRLFGR